MPYGFPLLFVPPIFASEKISYSGFSFHNVKVNCTIFELYALLIRCYMHIFTCNSSHPSHINTTGRVKTSPIRIPLATIEINVAALVIALA